MDPIVPQSVLMKHLEKLFDQTFEQQYYLLMHNKLGLHNSPGQKKLIDDFFETMDICSSHFTNVFRILEKNLSG